MNKIEYLQPHGFGIGFLIGKPDLLQRAVRHVHRPALQHLPAFSVERHEGPRISLGSSYPGRYFPARSHLQRAGKEHAGRAGTKRTASRKDAEDRDLRLCRHGLAIGLLGRHTGLHHIPPVSRKLQGERLGRCYLSALQHHFPVRGGELVADR